MEGERVKGEERRGEERRGEERRGEEKQGDDSDVIYRACNKMFILHELRLD